MTLPESLKKASRVLFSEECPHKKLCVDVVASFLETARKELKETLDGMKPLWTMAEINDLLPETKKIVTLSQNSKLYSRAQIYLMIDAVFGVEEEHYQEDEYQPTEQEIHDLGGEGK